MSTIDFDKKVVVKNLCNWDVGFPRIETAGDVHIVGRGSIRLSLGEVQAQVHANNSHVTGVDGKGNHAKVYIDDKEARVFLGFESEDEKEKQFILNADEVKKILEINNMPKFEKEIKTKVLTQAEKDILVAESQNQKLNDFKKIKFIEDYTGYKFSE